VNSTVDASVRNLIAKLGVNDDKWNASLGSSSGRNLGAFVGIGSLAYANLA